MRTANLSAAIRRPARTIGVKNRRLTFEDLERRELLSAESLQLAATNLCDVTLWDGERKDASGPLLNNLGGSPAPGKHATVSYATDVVHGGQGVMRIDTNGPIAAGDFDFVQEVLGATGYAPPYMDTRDLTHYESFSFWIRNQTGAAFTLELGVKDYLNSNGQQAKWAQTVTAADQWTRIQVPLDLSQGWTVIGQQPDLARARFWDFVINANQGAAVSGSVYLDDLLLTEPGGPIDPTQTSATALAAHLAHREFDALWGARDRDTGFLPQMSSFEDVVATNVTAGLVETLPGAVQRGWVSAGAANDYVAVLVEHVEVVMNGATYLPARYLDRVTLQAKNEESVADGALMYLALYQYKSLPATPAPLRASVEHVLGRFNFGAFADSRGWTMAYDPATPAFSASHFDGYSGEIGMICLAADLAGQVDMAALYNSGVNRVAVTTLGATATYLVHSNIDYRSPFMQWLFPLLVDVSQRGPDNYPVPELAGNPLDNAVTYQLDVDARLAGVGRGTLLQPDAGDDFTGTNYHSYSVFNDFGRPTLVMPWSSSFTLLAEPGASSPALAQLLAANLHGPFGMVDSAYWTTGQPAPYDVASRNDLWNTTLSLMAFDQYVYQDNQFLASVPAVAAALDKVFGPQAAVTPAEEFILESANLHCVSGNASDLGQAIVPIYTDYNTGGDYLQTVYAGGMTLDGDDPDAAIGLSSWRATMSGSSGWFEFVVGTTTVRNIPDFGSADTVRFMAKGDKAGQQVQVNLFRNVPGGGQELLAGASPLIALTTGWQEFAIDLPSGLGPADIYGVQYVLGGSLDPGNKTFRIDELRIDTAGYDPLRLVQSYRPENWEPVTPSDGTLADREGNVYPNRSFLYDNALAVKSLLSTADVAARTAALQIADALIATALPDGSYDNQRSAGHVLNADGTPLDPWSQQRTLGDNAWFGLALIDVYAATGNVDYLNAARRISDWAEANLKDTGALGGYRGGYDASGNPFPWRSTEHCIDCFALNWQLAAQLAGRNDPAAATYAQRATHAGDFVMAMFDATDGKFWTGTGAGDTINKSSVPLDVQLWAGLALVLVAQYAGAIDWSRPIAWAESHLQTTDGPYSGFTYSNQSTANRVWLEGTAQAAVLYAVRGETTKYAATLEKVEYTRIMHPNGDGRGVVAVSSDSLIDVELGATYDARRHTGATAWLDFAARRINPLIAIAPGGPTTIGLFDPASSFFSLRDSNTSGPPDDSFGFGQPGGDWQTLVGDWNGDGATGVGLFDPKSSLFYLTNAHQTGYAENTFGYGMPNAGWIPLVGDWNADGMAGVGLYDPHESVFYLSDTLRSGYAQYTFAYGVPEAGWVPLVGDWNGDGRCGVGLFDPHESTFYLTDTLQTGFAEHTFAYGQPDGGWQPLAGDWDGDRAQGVGLFDPGASTFYLTNAFVTGYAQYTFGYGQPDGGWKPLVGDWNGNGAAGVGLYDPTGSTFYLTDTLTTGYAQYTIDFGTPGAGCQPLVGCWTTGAGQKASDFARISPPAAKAVDQIDLADVVARELSSASALDDLDTTWLDLAR